MSDDHIIKLPFWVWILKIVQAVFALLVLAFSAYLIDQVDGSAYVNSASSHWDGFSLAIFTAIFTLLILGYYFGSLHFFPALYNWIAVLALECLAFVFWLSSFADMADMYRIDKDAIDYAIDHTFGDYQDGFKTYSGVFQANIAFSVLTWITYIVTLVFLALGIHGHRSEGKPMLAGGATTADEEKYEVQPVPAAAPAAAPAPAPSTTYEPTSYEPSTTYENSAPSPTASPYPPAPGPYNPPTSASPPPPNVHEAM